MEYMLMASFYRIIYMFLNIASAYTYILKDCLHVCNLMIRKLLFGQLNHLRIWIPYVSVEVLGYVDFSIMFIL